MRRALRLFGKRVSRFPHRALGVLFLAIPVPAHTQDVGADILRGLQAPRESGEVRASADTALPFTSSADLRAATVTRHVRELRAINPVAAAEVAREMAKHEYDAIFRGFLDGTGLRPDDAGDVLTAFVALQWMVANDSKADPSPAALQALRRQFVLPMAGKPPLSQESTRAAFAEQVKLRMVLHHAGWQAAQRLGVLPRYVATLSNEFIAPAKLRALALTDEGLVTTGRAGGAPSAGLPAETPPSAALSPLPQDRPPLDAPPSGTVDEAAPPCHAANWSEVEGVYFRSTTGIGVGGMVIVDYEPLILFRDGSYYEIADAALEDVDLLAERAARPRRFGRWTRAGAGFALTGTSGKPQSYTLQDGSFFRAFPAASGETFARGYRRLSGGGNSAMGGDMMIAVSSRYDFRPDGTYGRGGSVGATNSGASTGVGTTVARRRPPEGGRYALDRHTLTLTAADGRSRRHFFAFGSQKDPPQPDRDMIFVGDSVFSTPE